jgi:hypothetical protein
MSYPDTSSLTPFDVTRADTLTLQSGRARRLHGAPGTWLHVVSGSLWLTQSGDPEDYFLAAGQSKQIGSGRAVIESGSTALLTYALLNAAHRVERGTSPGSVAGASVGTGLAPRLHLHPGQLKTL